MYSEASCINYFWRLRLSTGLKVTKKIRCLGDAWHLQNEEFHFLYQQVVFNVISVTFQEMTCYWEKRIMKELKCGLKIYIDISKDIHVVSNLLKSRTENRLIGTDQEEFVPHLRFSINAILRSVILSFR